MLNLHFAPIYAVATVAVEEVADVSPFPGTPPSLTHWAGPLLFCTGVMTNICQFYVYSAQPSESLYATAAINKRHW